MYAQGHIHAGRHKFNTSISCTIDSSSRFRTFSGNSHFIMDHVMSKMLFFGIIFMYSPSASRYYFLHVIDELFTNFCQVRVCIPISTSVLRHYYCFIGLPVKQQSVILIIVVYHIPYISASRASHIPLSYRNDHQSNKVTHSDRIRI